MKLTANTIAYYGLIQALLGWFTLLFAYKYAMFQSYVLSDVPSYKLIYTPNYDRLSSSIFAHQIALHHPHHA